MRTTIRVEGRESRFPDRGRKQNDTSLCSYLLLVEKVDSPIGDENLCQASGRSFSSVEKVDSPIGDENNGEQQALRDAFRRESRFPDRGRKLCSHRSQWMYRNLVEKVDSPIGDENCTVIVRKFTHETR